MKTHKTLPVLAAVGLAIGLAGCDSSEPKAASAPAHKVPTAVQMSQEKQALMVERNMKAAKDYVAKVKAEKEAEAEAQTQAQIQAGTQAGSGTQTQARSGGNYQGRSNYQAPRRSGGGYQAPRSGGNSGGGSEWKVGESRDYKEDSSRWTYRGNGNYEVSGCGDSEGNTWPC